MRPELGVCYYPEHWPEDIWAEDAARMVATGIAWVRIGEFAWSRMEPEPGRLDLDWLDRAVSVLGAAGLKIVMGTPTATPPRWMIARHPDMLATDAEGRARAFGSRRHYCFSHEGYRRECARIARIMGERYGRNPHVAAWQIDNEYACHETTLSYSPAARAAFRDWLAQRYQSPDALNRAWGNVFWSMEYADFAEIDPPVSTVTEPNPSHVLDWKRFSSDQVAAFNRVQVEALRPLTDAPLLHNYMGRELTFDHFDVGADLDIATWDSYPIGFLSDRLDSSEADKLTYLRQGDPDNQALHHDIYRAVGRGRWWVMEQQPGPVNWAPWNPAPLPGMVRLWSWEAIAHGAEVVSYFRWRQAPFAQEQNHAGLLRPDSTPAPGLAEARQVADEIAALGPVEQVRAQAALVFDYEAEWFVSTQPQGADFTYFGLVLDAYRALRRAGLSVDILRPGETVAGYGIVLAPGLVHLSDEAKAALGAADGVVVAGPRTAARTRDFHIPVPLPPALPGLDAVIGDVESLPPGADEAIEGGGMVGRWIEHVEGGAPVHLATEAGVPVLLGETLLYLTGWPDAAGWDRVVALACDRAGLPRHAMPPGLRLRRTKHHVFAFNYAPVSLDWNGHRIEPGGVAWWPVTSDAG